MEKYQRGEEDANEARNILAEAYEKTYDAKGIALVYGVFVPTVYRLAE